MLKRMFARTLVGAAGLVIGLVVVSVDPASACTRDGVRGDAEMRPRPLYWGPAYYFQELNQVAIGLRIFFGPEAESHFRLRWTCLSAEDFDEARPRLTAELTPGQYGVLAGIVIPNSTPCPNDFLVVFLSTPPGGQTQVLPACLGQLPAVPFPAIPPITLSDEAAPGDQGFFELFRLPFLIDYPVAYFVALTTPGAPVSSVLTGAVAVTICVPGSDGLGGAIFNCSS